MNDRNIESEIEQLLRLLCPDMGSMDGYQLSCVKGIVNHFRKMGEQDPSTLWRWQNYTESIQVSIMNNLVSHIEKDIIEGKMTYLWKQDKDRSEFEKGVYAAIRLIQFRVHCIMDD